MKRFHRGKPFIGFLFSVLCSVCLLANTSVHAQPTTSEMLLEYAVDYAADVSLQTVTFGIQVDDNWWTVSTHVATEKAYGVADIYAGKPPFPTFYFKLDAATLKQIYNRELNALTAMGKARATDVTPMDIDVMDGFEPQEGFLATALSVAFHFWTRDTPERIPFGGEYTRTVHGAQASVFYYQPGFRSAFFQILPGQHANEDAADQVNPFPSLFVVIDGGTARGRIGGAEVELRGREAIFIPANVPHEFWNHGDIPAEGVLLMFGDGA